MAPLRPLLMLLGALAEAAVTGREFGNAINMAGRQRMLSQRMSKEFFLISKGYEVDGNRANLVASIDLFHCSLAKLINGSAEDGIPAAPSENSLLELNKVLDLWLPFKVMLEDDMRKDPIPAEGLEFVRTHNLPLLKQANTAVSRLVDAARASGVETAGLQVDVAGRQRMLSQKMSKEVVMASLHMDKAGTLKALLGTMELFDSSHFGLLRGMHFLGLPETRNICVLRQMRIVSDYWRQFEPLIRRISYDAVVTSDMLRQVAALNPVLLKEMNSAVMLYVTQPSECPNALSSGDWLRALREVALGQQMLRQCGRLFLQIAADVDAAASRTILQVRFSHVEQSLRSVIEGSISQQIVSPVSQPIADCFILAWTSWVKFHENVRHSISHPPITNNDVERAFSYGSVAFAEALHGLELYLSAAAAADPSLPVGSIGLASRLSVAVERVVLEAAKGLFNGDPSSSGRIEAALATFDTARSELLHGRPAAPNAFAANRTSDACVLRHMQTLGALWDPLAKSAREFAASNASGALLREMGLRATELYDKLQQVVELYTFGRSGCGLKVTDREWEALIAKAGHLNTLCQRVFAELALAARGVSAAWGGSRGRLAAALADIGATLEMLTFGSAAAGIPSPPTQALADHLLWLGDLWAAFVRSQDSLQGRRLAAQGEATLEAAIALVSLYSESASAAGSSVPAARITVAGQQPALVERLQREVAELQPGSAAGVEGLRRGLRDFEAAHKRLLHGSSDASLNLSSRIPPTTERPIIPQMQKVMDEFQRFKAQVEAVAAAGYASDGMLSGMIVTTAALAMEADKAAQLYGRASMLAALVPARILAPLPLTGVWNPGGVMQVAATLAQDIINEQQLLLPGVALSTVFVDDRCDERQGMRSVLDMVTKSSNWVGLGGMACSPVCASTAIVASSVRLPVVSYGCAAGHQGDSTVHTGFVRLGTAMTGTAKLVTDLAAKFGWKQLRVLSDNSKGNVQDTEALVQELRQGSGLGVDWKSFSATNWQQVKTTAQLLLDDRLREVFLMGDEYFCRRVICAAKAVGISKGMTWISSGLKSRGWYSRDDAWLLAQDPSCTGEFITENSQGLLNVAGAGKPRSELADAPLDCLQGHTSRSFERLVEQRLATGHAMGSRLYDGVAGLAADGTCVFAYALRHMLQQGYGVEQLERPGQDVYQQMLTYIQDGVSFFGVSGNVSFTGVEKPGNLALWQIQGNGTVMVGLSDVNGTTSLAANGGPSSASWAPHPPDPPMPQFPWLVLPCTFISLLICSAICLGIYQGLRTAKVAERPTGHATSGGDVKV